MQKATNLYNLVELKNNIQLTDEDVPLYYVSPPGKEAHKIHRFFQLKHQYPQKMLFIGPRGAGKRSLLNYLAIQKFEYYHCLTIDLLQRLHFEDMSQVDIIFCLLSHLIDDLSKTVKRLDPGVLNHIYQNLHDEQLISLVHFKKSEAGDAEGTKIGFVKSFIDAVLEAIATAGSEIRNHIRNSFEPRLRRILKSVQKLIDYSNQMLQRDGRKLLIIFTDLGELNQSAEKFFQNHLPLTQRLKTNIIYTMPDFIQFSPLFQTIYDCMDRVEYLRITPVVNHDQTPFEPGKEYINTIISKRIDSQLIPETIKSSIILASGGVIRDALYLIQETAICSLTENADCERLQQSVFNQVKRQFVRQKIQQLNYQQFCLLKELNLSNPSWTGNTEIQSLMRKNMLIEYETDQNIWFDIHPLVKEYLKTGSI